MLSAKTMVSTLRTSSHSKLLRFVIVDSNTFNAYKSVLKTFSTVRTASTMRLSPQLLYKIILRASAVGSTNIGSITHLCKRVCSSIHPYEAPKDLW